ncbi:hypothetical protein GIW37_24295 [Pseudomonas syringae]|nr:hypothetical protein [Pseudomonas syringae]MCF5210878.1 hypothetical protein [Pseudomonas syringae]MCF5215429.1 hypothetical protein [Pseudomonas syringae]MCF5218631.1 hypothetical protein [Pseudomonas syringae]MCF5266174.1 hypothetical protein [Pseudomonas syringae]
MTRRSARARSNRIGILAKPGRSELVREDGRSNDKFQNAFRPLREQVRSHGLRPESEADS